LQFFIKLRRRERAVAFVTIGYIASFTAWFLISGNYEFVVYVLTMLVLLTLIGRSLRSVEYPISMLWALSIWGLLHMAGGGVPVDGSVLYAVQILPITSAEGELRLLKYDQIVHAYGFGVTAWLLWYLLKRHFPMLMDTKTSLLYPALASMGLGTVNEIIEFMAVLVVSDTNVGGYYNTALDLVFNALGAAIAMAIIAVAPKVKRPVARNTNTSSSNPEH
jgi:putative membrane protein